VARLRDPGNMLIFGGEASWKTSRSEIEERMDDRILSEVFGKWMLRCEVAGTGSWSFPTLDAAFVL
jgi:hypothetical protein